MKSPTLRSSDKTVPGCPPPIRWAGSKRLLLPRLVQYLPSRYRRYYEPMIGSGALLFYLKPQAASLGDINPELMNFYAVLQKQPRALYAEIAKFKPSARNYYAIRGRRPAALTQRAARFFFLTRLSWNGLYRVNKSGAFNVPYSGRMPRRLTTLERFVAASRALERAQLYTGDVTTTTSRARSGDFVYLDPPYPRGASSRNGFSRYTKDSFSFDDHRALANLARTLADRGVHVLVTVCARKEFLDLYPGFHSARVRMPSLIAADSAHRRDSYEAILTSYTR